ncbi:MAG: nucleotidyltransferase domain-containing protein [Patescibacteria group bacterium]
MVTKTIFKKIEKNALDYIYYLKKQGLSIKKAIIYGSYAKGNIHQYSDIDLCIISTKFKKIDALNYLWTKKRGKDIKAMISPIGFHPKDFINENPLVWEIKKTGIEIKV